MPILQKAFEAENPFDLCISDIQMPGMDGYDVAKQIRNLKSSIRSIPLLALSSLMERDAKKCEEAGFDGFLSKPVRREKLYKILEKIIGKRAESREQRAGGEEERIVTQYSVNEEMKHSVRILLGGRQSCKPEIGKVDVDQRVDIMWKSPITVRRQSKNTSHHQGILT